jgi:hypothetical protein
MTKEAEEKEPLLFRILESDKAGFCSSMSPITSEELEVLKDMRELKKRARKIKLHLSQILPDWKQWIDKSEAPILSGEAKSYIQDFRQLRERWKDLEAAWEEARHRRMVALGHEDP